MVSVECVRPGIRVGFTGTDAGNLAFHVGDDAAQVSRRRALLEAEIAAGTGHAVPLRYMNQVHGADVAMLGPGAPAMDSVITADAMVMDPAGQGAGLAVMVADCVPVVLVGDRADGGTLLGVAHAGRPGVETGVIDAVLTRLRHEGATSIEAWLGPSVCGRCYEVPAPMREAVSHKVPEAFATTSWGTPALDLPAAVLAQLAANGVAAHPSGVCTLEDSNYYSHRRSQRDGEAEGRFIGFITATPRPENLRNRPQK